jgi:hypothetical protein
MYGPMLLLIALGAANAQIYYQQPLPYALQAQPLVASQPASLAHPAVVATAAAEQQLPQELLKSNQFYSNPHVAEGLAKDSWFSDKEMPVFEREADKIPRDRVERIFKNAGFIRRR